MVRAKNRERPVEPKNMRPLMLSRVFVLSACASGLGCSSDADNSARSHVPPVVDAGNLPAPSDFAAAPKSCVYECAAECAERATPYVCPSLGPWNAIPHDPVCPAWDGTYPPAVATKCTATAPTGEAALYAGADPSDPKATILPDGRRIRAAGAEWIFNEKELIPGGPSNAIPVPNTPYLLVVDTGYGAHSVRLVDRTKIASGRSPVVSYVAYPPPAALNSEIAFVAPDLVLLSTDDGAVRALKLDTAAGLLTKDDSRTITLPASVDDQRTPAPYYVAGLAVSPDAKRLVVTSVFDTRALVFDLSTGHYGTLLGSVDIGEGGTFACAFDPNDASGQFAYATKWGGHALVAIDVSHPMQPTIAQRFAIDKNPQGFAFLDARWVAVANDFGDTIALVDRVSGAVTSVPVDVATTLHGQEPSTVAYDSANKRLYATLAAENALGVWSVDLSTTPPTLVPAGKVPTSWWPTSVSVASNGELAITSMRGHSNGPLDTDYAAGDGDSMNGVRGGVQLVPMPSAVDLTDGEWRVRTNDAVGELEGAPNVTCPNHEADFPVPPTNTEGASKQISHVIFVLRENKSFDSLFGDLPGVFGDPALTMKESSADMDRIWQNLRALARDFALSDNYYTDAELSNQGHTWMTYGRTSDFTERTWHLNGYSRHTYSSPVQPQGTSDIGEPIEGSLFDWLQKNNIKYDVLGEAEGLPQPTSGPSPVDPRYPGGFIQNIGYPDIEKSCYAAGRIRVLCDIGQFVYMTLPNDHTLSISPTVPSPEAMIAVNDEATGAVVDAISHSPLWPNSLVIMTEDDPADGGDHVEHHRTPIVFASPWIKRHYVSTTHIDVSSLHKLLAHIFGIPYENAVVAAASLPLDAFSSTPDYASYDYKPRAWPSSCGVTPTLAEQKLRDSWSFDEVDQQPGLDAQIRRYMRRKQLKTLPRAMAADIAERTRQKSRLSSPKDDD